MSATRVHECSGSWWYDCDMNVEVYYESSMRRSGVPYTGTHTLSYKREPRVLLRKSVVQLLISDARPTVEAFVSFVLFLFLHNPKLVWNSSVRHGKAVDQVR